MGDFLTLPQAAVATGGFPCQAFSYAGKKPGLADARGTLFYELARVVQQIMPPICAAATQALPDALVGMNRA